jgi:AraC-like DNA-binding protein
LPPLSTTRARSSLPEAPRALGLSRFVEHIELVTPSPDEVLDVDRLPDGRTTLVFRTFATTEGGHTDVAVAGPRTAAHFKRAAGLVRALSVRFKPGWSTPLLGVPASVLTDRILPLDELWGEEAGELQERVATTHTLPEAIAALAEAFRSRGARAFEPASAPLVRRAIHLLEAADGRVEVERIAARLGVSSRHLRRAFAESVGVGPKDFARSVRLQHALRQTNPPPPLPSRATAAARPLSLDWARIATEAGYYDQAHLITEFRRLVGLTPGAFVKRVNDRQRHGAAGDSAA